MQVVHGGRLGQRNENGRRHPLRRQEGTGRVSYGRYLVSLWLRFRVATASLTHFILEVLDRQLLLSCNALRCICIAF